MLIKCYNLDTYSPQLKYLHKGNNLCENLKFILRNIFASFFIFLRKKVLAHKSGPTTRLCVNTFLMKKAYSAILILLISFAKVYAGTALDFASQDTAEVNLLNKQGFAIHQTDHDETIKKGEQALEIAQKINYINGIAEAYRIMG